VFLPLALEGSEWSASCPHYFTPGERAPGTHWIGGWVGPRAGLDTEKFPAPARNQTPPTLIVQPVASCCTD